MTGRAASTLTALGYRAAWATASRLPADWGEPAISRVSDRIVSRRGPAVVQLAKNLRRVLGDDATPAALHAATRAAMRSYGRYWWETFRLHRLDPHAVADNALAGTVGTEHVYAARDHGRGIILALPHSGNWDIAGMSMVSIFGGITTVAEQLKPESLYRRFVTYRERLGFEVLPLGQDTGASAGTAAILRQRLEQGRMVCLLADRDLAGNGVPVTFFGERTTMPAGPALLAARTGADLCPVHLAYTDDGWIQFVGAPLTLQGTRLADKVRNGTQQLADAFAARIALFPADWHMLQPLWPADRPSGGPGTESAS